MSGSFYRQAGTMISIECLGVLIEIVYVPLNDAVSEPAGEVVHTSYCHSDILSGCQPVKEGFGSNYVVSASCCSTMTQCILARQPFQ